MKHFIKFCDKLIKEDTNKSKNIIRVEEDPFYKKERIARGFTQIVVVDPKMIEKGFEEHHKGEKLVHTPARLRDLEGVKTLHRYPLVSGTTCTGKEGIDVADGRHRIAEAIRQGKLIEVAVDPDYPLPSRYIVETSKVKDIREEIEELPKALLPNLKPYNGELDDLAGIDIDGRTIGFKDNSKKSHEQLGITIEKKIEGIIRFKNSSIMPMVDIWKEPTKEQYRTLSDILQYKVYNNLIGASLKNDKTTFDKTFRTKSFIQIVKRFFTTGTIYEEASLHKENINEDVFHGSTKPWKREKGYPYGKPDLSKIGTGEGNQMYGWGWYSAEIPNVAKFYAARDFKYEEKLMYLYKQAERVHDYLSMEVLEDALMHQSIRDLKQKYSSNEYDEYFQKKALKTIQQIEKIPKKVTFFKFHINDDLVEKLLIWDFSWEQQSDYVKEKLKYENISDNSTGGTIYTNKAMATNRQEASLYFLEKGIPGLKYLDQESRNMYEGYPRLLNNLKFHKERLTDWNQTLQEFLNPEKQMEDKETRINDLKENIERIENEIKRIEKLLKTYENTKKTWNYVIWDQKVLDEITMTERDDNPIIESIDSEYEKLSDRYYKDNDKSVESEVKELERKMKERDIAFEKMAQAQRSEPERLSTKTFPSAASGYYQNALEHIGDLTHRLGEHFSNYHGLEAIPKIKSQLRVQNNDFRNIVYEQIESNNKYYKEKGLTNITDEEAIEKIKEHGQKYSEAHSKIPIYNELQYHARQAAIELGLWHFSEVRKHLQWLKDVIDSGNFVEKAGEFNGQEYKVDK